MLRDGAEEIGPHPLLELVANAIGIGLLLANTLLGLLIGRCERKRERK